MKALFSALSTNYLLLVCTLAVNLVLLPLCLSTLGTERAGIYFLLLSINNFLTLSIGWLNQAGVPLLASRIPDAVAFDKMVRALTITYLIMGILTLIGLTIVGYEAGTLWLAGSPWSGEARNACILLGFLNCVLFLQSAQAVTLNVINQQTASNLLRIGATILFGLLAMGSLLLYGRFDLLLGAQIVAQCALLIAAKIALRRLKPKVVPRCSFAAELQIIFSRFGATYFGVGILQFLLLFGDIFLVGYFFGPSIVTVYVVLTKAPEFGALLTSRVSEVLVPFLARESSESAKIQLMARAMRYNLLLNTALTIGFAFAGRELVTLWVGSDHTPRSPYLYVLCAFASFFQATNRHVLLCHIALAQVSRVLPTITIEATARLVGWLVLVQLGFTFESAFLANVMVNGMYVFWRMQFLGEKLIATSLNSILLETYAPVLIFGVFTVCALNLWPVTGATTALSAFFYTAAIIAAFLLAAIGVTAYRDKKMTIST